MFPAVDYWKWEFSFGLQERVPEEERKHHEALGDLHAAVDEDSRSEISSAEEGKENTRLLLKRLKALEVRHPTVHTLREKPAGAGTDCASKFLS